MRHFSAALAQVFLVVVASAAACAKAGGLSGGFSPEPAEGGPLGDATEAADRAADPDVGSIADVAAGDQGITFGCPSGAETTLTGTVYDPAGLHPLYNVLVYVPTRPPDPFKQGVSCDQCASVLPKGAATQATLTAPDGTFVLRGVPHGKDIPLVMQIGKWRRQITLPNVTECATNTIADKNLTRLPKNKKEGDIPLMAMVTGGADQFECLLLAIGIDPTEFTDAAGTGRVHMYAGMNGAVLAGSPFQATDLWPEPARLAQYDVLINACEGDPFPDEKPQSSVNNVAAYVNQGGRLFATHYQYYWLSDYADFQFTANFAFNGPIQDPFPATVNQSFPKGQAFAQWLVVVGASTTPGLVSLGHTRSDATTANAPSLAWLTGTNTAAQPNQPALLHYTFNTPVKVPVDEQCGKVLYSDFHVAEAGGGTFPAECAPLGTSPQELALEFMLFDLSSCIENDADGGGGVIQ